MKICSIKKLHVSPGIRHRAISSLWVKFSMLPDKFGNKIIYNISRLRFSFSVQFYCTNKNFKWKTNICNSLRKIVSFGQPTTIQAVSEHTHTYAILQVASLLMHISLRMDAPISTTTKTGCSEVTTVQIWRRWRHMSSGMLSDWGILASLAHWWRHTTRDSTHSLNCIMMTLKAFKSFMVSNYEVLIIQYSKAIITDNNILHAQCCAKIAIHVQALLYMYVRHIVHTSNCTKEIK